MNTDKLQVSDEQIEEGYKLVGYTLRKYFPYYPFYKKSQGLAYEDLRQIGIIGWWKALDAYDESQGEFSTLAVKYIRTEIYTEVRTKYKGFKASAEIAQGAVYLRSKGINDETLKYIEEKYKLSKKMVERTIVFANLIMINGDKPIKNLENLTYFESIEDKEYAHKFEMLDYEIGLEERLNVLNETQRTCVTMRLEGYSPTEIGEILGKSKENVSTQINLSIKKIGRHFKHKDLRAA
ncbi:sigma-70 family RNA polymerase sigma factor [Bacillus thuringiensis]|uniref:sigma-70 family RNA polymerase sigma factor n=1 Tax=Bacillus thuringiensis TaxID=1428 RepID=UPI000BF60B63|nr:sigma-70 family RNA polymerase sigma factor [Bacillus thuringiensis]PFC28519.1 hypothetical protein CN299_19810 [Bacillus thuringiensis]